MGSDLYYPIIFIQITQNIFERLNVGNAVQLDFKNSFLIILKKKQKFWK